MTEYDRAGLKAPLERAPIVSRFFRKFNFHRLAAGSQPAMISDSSSSSGLER